MGGGAEFVRLRQSSEATNVERSQTFADGFQGEALLLQLSNGTQGGDMDLAVPRPSARPLTLRGRQQALMDVVADRPERNVDPFAEFADLEVRRWA